jgi:phosphomevalonate kinase
VSTQFHSTVFRRFASASDAESKASSLSFDIVVAAPQRSRRVCAYRCSIAQQQQEEEEEGEASKKTTIAVSKQSPLEEDNPFVQHTLQNTLTVIAHVLGAEAFAAATRDATLCIHLEGDVQFYAGGQQQKQDEAKEDKKQQQQLTQAQLEAMRNAKTGLGSSAALVSSLVAALFDHFSLFKKSGNNNNNNTRSAMMSLAHNTAQFCHCKAQGKVGSGFDVSSAFFGTQCYRRFAPSVLAALLDAPSGKLSGAVLHKALHPATSSWTNSAASFSLPPGMQLVLGDVAGGSKTPGMVRSVLKRLRRDGDAKQQWAVWTELAACNARVEATLRELCSVASSADTAALYAHAVAACAKMPSSAWDPDRNCVVALLLRLQREFADLRVKLRQMGAEAAVPIEPEPQTRLLDATQRVPGVLFCGVPGAGGYDAIFAVLLNANVVPRLDAMWRELPKHDVKASQCTRLLGVQQQLATNGNGVVRASGAAVVSDAVLACW